MAWEYPTLPSAGGASLSPGGTAGAIQINDGVGGLGGLAAGASGNVPTSNGSGGWISSPLNIPSPDIKDIIAKVNPIWNPTTATFNGIWAGSSLYTGGSWGVYDRTTNLGPVTRARLTNTDLASVGIFRKQITNTTGDITRWGNYPTVLLPWVGGSTSSELATCGWQYNMFVGCNTGISLAVSAGKTLVGFGVMEDWTGDKNLYFISGAGGTLASFTIEPMLDSGGSPVSSLDYQQDTGWGLWCLIEGVEVDDDSDSFFGNPTKIRVSAIDGQGNVVDSFLFDSALGHKLPTSPTAGINTIGAMFDNLSPGSAVNPYYPAAGAIYYINNLLQRP